MDVTGYICLELVKFNKKILLIVFLRIKNFLELIFCICKLAIVYVNNENRCKLLVLWLNNHCIRNVSIFAYGIKSSLIGFQFEHRLEIYNVCVQSNRSDI